MAKCKICRTEIVDGKEYCSNCQDKEIAKSNESYLDSLLSSVKNSAPAVENVYKKKTSNVVKNETIKPNSPEIQEEHSTELDFQDYMTYSVLDEDIIDFDNYSNTEDFIGDADLFGEDISKLLSFKDLGIEDYAASKEDTNEWDLKQVDDSNTSLEDSSKNLNIDGFEESKENNNENNNEDNKENNNEDNKEEIIETSNKEGSEDNIEENTEENTEEKIKLEDELNQKVKDIDFITYSELDEMENYEDEFDPDLNDLLSNLDTYQKNMELEEELSSSLKEVVREEQDIEQDSEDQEDDFLSLLNQLSVDDPVTEDVKAINDMLNGEPVSHNNQMGLPSDVGEVFSDVLKVVSSLNDSIENEEEILASINGSKEDKSNKKKKGKKSKKKNIEDSQEGEPKKGFWQRLFGNVKDDKANKANKANKAESTTNESADDSDQTKKTDAKKLDKKVKAVKGKKEATATSEDVEDSGKGSKQAKGKKGKATEDDSKAAKASKSKKEKPKKDKAKKEKANIERIDEIEEDEGRINRFGAFVVFLFFGLFAMLIYLGTNVISYTLSIQNATNYFDKQEYTDAYNEVYGIDIKAEDIEIYDKIMTVMFVNKQLNSYNNFYSMGQYPQALDSLLKGLKRYDKYIELATLLGIKTDLDYVRSQILGELSNVFMLTEEEAVAMNSYENMSKYSMEVFDVVLENIEH